jgi:hypothetical protein
MLSGIRCLFLRNKIPLAPAGETEWKNVKEQMDYGCVCIPVEFHYIIVVDAMKNLVLQSGQ